MAGGRHAPTSKEEASFSPLGLADDLHAQGMEAARPRPPQVGTVHDSPPFEDAPYVLWHLP